MNLESKLKDKENHLTYENVTPKELRRTNYSDKKDRYIQVTFSSKSGCIYEVGHSSGASNIGVSTDPRNRDELVDVTRIICEKLRVEPPTKIEYPLAGATMWIQFTQEHTQEEIADIIENIYVPNFIDVWISYLAYYKTSKKEFENSKIPKYKVSKVNSEEIDSNFYKIYRYEINYFLDNPNKATYHNVRWEPTLKEIKNRLIQDRKFYTGSFKFYASDGSKYNISLMPYYYPNNGDSVIVVRGDKKYVNSLAELISGLTKDNNPIDYNHEDEQAVRIRIRNGGNGKIKCENILDLVNWLDSKNSQQFSCSVVYRDLTKGEFDMITPKADLSKAYALVKNRELDLHKLFGKVDADSLPGLYTSLDDFKCYFAFLSLEKKKVLLEHITKNKEKLNPEIIKWMNETQRHSIEHITIMSFDEK